MQKIDPFGFWPDNGSRISGLGGAGALADHNYVFHSLYVDVPPGPSFAEIRFKGLRAQSGMIGIRIYQNLPGGTPAVTEQAKTTALLPSLGESKRPIRIGFDALPGATYAVLGYVFGECEAQARALVLRVGAIANEGDDPALGRSLFGKWKARRAAGLSSIDAPSLAWPVSQGYGEAQLKQPEFRHWAGSLPAHATAMQQWESAYILQVLEKYGRLAAGARGLGLAMGSDPVASLAAAAGCDITSVVLDQGEALDAAAQRVFSGSDSGKGFDFIWSRSEVFGSGGPARAMALIAELQKRMRPGGLGVHLVMLGTGEMDDNAVNRIAIGLAAEGHFVAQIRHDRATPRPPGGVPFGLVVRKSTDGLLA